MRALTILCLGWLFAAPALAVNPDEVLKDPALEQRARELSAEIRCLVCQNQSIDDSDADLARDLRRLVRERIEKGDSDQAIKDYLVSRYGEFVLLKPPVRTGTYFLWAGPFIILALGALGIAVFLRHRRVEPAKPDAASLSDEEKKRIEALLAEEERS